jgi:hypothetical protein
MSKAINSHLSDRRCLVVGRLHWWREALFQEAKSYGMTNSRARQLDREHVRWISAAIHARGFNRNETVWVLDPDHQTKGVEEALVMRYGPPSTVTQALDFLLGRKTT